ncbi:hypothetical protein CYY_004337 [Polysphondylium violaceum]|uniref:Importin subunit alpha n=1 Tax=Polysphondylium violaceum TaxID=133409 RepID=A0A8J4PVK4_9MYCE|nr:hypothetical protein CYY_004337 [Polysphondylium violaceum]
MNRDKQDRKNSYKQAIDSEAARRKREETTTGIRKSSREDFITKKRREQIESLIANTTTTADELVISEELKSQFLAFEKETLEKKLKNLVALTSALNSEDRAMVYCALVQFRKLLSLDKNPPIDAVLECNIIPKLNQLLACNNTQVQFEAAWALTNIASGNSKQTEAVIKGGSVSIFIEILSQENATAELKEQCAWALGNIAGDSIQSRDWLLDLGVLNPLIALLNHSRLALVQNVIWTISNLCRGKPQPNIQKLLPVLASINEAINKNENSDILGDLCWTASYLCDGPNEKIQLLVNTGIVPRLVELLSAEPHCVYTPALRAIGNIVTGDASQTQLALDCGVLEPLTNMLLFNRKSIQKEACWALSNLTAGTSEQISQVISHPNTAGYLIDLMSHSQFEVKREACWALSNATNGSPKVVQFLYQNKIIERFVECLDHQDTILIKVVLEGLLNMVKVGEELAKKSGINPYVVAIAEADGDISIETLQQHSSKEIYKKALELSSYFEQADDDIENNEPNTNYDNNTFSFNNNSNTNHIDI